ncbi:MAG: hypothetical protein INH40_20840 [Acidobacteriaceae bacterium]|nr:hypothetical protein [Acidobacteriaceae bacterium]
MTGTVALRSFYTRLAMPGCSYRELPTVLGSTLAGKTASVPGCLCTDGWVPFSLWKRDCSFWQAYGREGGPALGVAAFESRDSVARGGEWREFRLWPFWGLREAMGELGCLFVELPESLQPLWVRTVGPAELEWRCRLLAGGSGRAALGRREGGLRVEAAVRGVVEGGAWRELQRVWPGWAEEMESHCREVLEGGSAVERRELGRRLAGSYWDGPFFAEFAGPLLTARLTESLSYKDCREIDERERQGNSLKRIAPGDREPELASTCLVEWKMATLPANRYDQERGRAVGAGDLDEIQAEVMAGIVEPPPGSSVHYEGLVQAIYALSGREAREVWAELEGLKKLGRKPLWRSRRGALERYAADLFDANDVTGLQEFDRILGSYFDGSGDGRSVGRGEVRGGLGVPAGAHELTDAETR